MRVTVGQTGFEMPRRSEHEDWSLYTKVKDDALGPHIIIQKELKIMYIELDGREIRRLRDWCKEVLRKE